MRDSATIQERLHRLARALCMEPVRGKPLSCQRDSEGRWWLCGTVGGDTVLPMTRRAIDVHDALDHAEGWLAPRLDDLDREAKEGA